MSWKSDSSNHTSITSPTMIVWKRMPPAFRFTAESCAPILRANLLPVVTSARRMTQFVDALSIRFTAQMPAAEFETIVTARSHPLVCGIFPLTLMFNLDRSLCHRWQIATCGHIS